MEEKKNNVQNSVIIILIILVLALSGFIVYDKVLSTSNGNDYNESKKNNENNSGTNTEGKQLSISDEKARELFERIKDYNYVIDSGKFKNSKVLKVSELDSDIIMWLLSNNIEEKNKISICGTEHEQDLINKNIITREGVGQFDCKTTEIYSNTDVKNAKNKLYGDNLKQLPTDYEKFQYYAKGDFWINQFCCYVDKNVTQYNGYEASSNVLSIKTKSINPDLTEEGNYVFNFNYSNNEYHLMSIEKVK